MTRLGQHDIPISRHMESLLSLTTGCAILYLWTADKIFAESLSLANLALCTPTCDVLIHFNLSQHKI